MEPHGAQPQNPDLWRRAVYRMTQAARFLPFYGGTLGAARGRGVHININQVMIWPGQSERGQAFLDGDYHYDGEHIKQAKNPWEALGASDFWLTSMNSFSCLHDLAALGSEDAFIKGRGLIMDWVGLNISVVTPAYRAPAWRSWVVGERLFNWVSCYDLFMADAQDDTRKAFVRSLEKQFMHLRRVAEFEGLGEQKIKALKGALVSALWLQKNEQMRANLWDSLTRQLQRQILPDGGHITRSPRIHMAVLYDLVSLRSAFETSQEDIPSSLQIAIDRMTPMLRFFLLGDKGLCLFNDSREGEHAAIHGLRPMRVEKSLNPRPIRGLNG
jgi:uncharacterized heparinase superfamily protein